ncbi:MAG: NADPH-dependent 2,4-dienoyl-CoA reductase [Burkholderiaceae bacterium]
MAIDTLQSAGAQVHPLRGTPFPRLMEPFSLGGRVLRNRVLMGAMHTGLEELPDGPRRMATYFGERARAGVAMIVTGGFAPEAVGAASEGKAIFDSQANAAEHRLITDEVHAGGSLILLQILHAGGYARHDKAVAASALPTPFCPVVPRMLEEGGIEQAIESHVRCAQLAHVAGYDGVEFLGAGGYLINGFFAPRTNHRTDRWGGCVANRGRLALEIVRRTREALGKNFIIGFRMSLLDLVEDGSTWDESVWLARALQEAGADFLGSAFGWHESPVPTIASVVPPAAFSTLTRRLRAAVALPIVATNRIHTPEQAETLLARGDADLVALARPLLADPHFVQKAAAGESERINTCIACNQACLDRTFSHGVVSCLVNPRACHETLWEPPKAAESALCVAVIGAGLAGLSCAVALAERGHEVTLHEVSSSIGGQFKLAARVPGKEDYQRTLVYYENRLRDSGVTLRLGSNPTAEELRGHDHVVIATGIRPRMPGASAWAVHPKVMRYDDLLSGRREAGQRVVIVGAGGIAFDVAEYLTYDGVHNTASFMAAWGIDAVASLRGGLKPAPATARSGRSVVLLQRGVGKVGRGLGRTTGWIKRRMLERRGVLMMTDAGVDAVDEDGVLIRQGGEIRRWEADTVVLCIGQESCDELSASLRAIGIAVSVIGGAFESPGIDAERAIRQGMRLGLDL